jgi:hypothetical protein
MMAGTYELWNTRTGNIVGAFENEEAALEAVCKAVESYGREYAEQLLLGRENSRGRSRMIATGAELVERAQPDGRRRIPA